MIPSARTLETFRPRRVQRSVFRRMRQRAHALAALYYGRIFVAMIEQLEAGRLDVVDIDNWTPDDG
jgi:hypothetical protein